MTADEPSKIGVVRVKAGTSETNELVEMCSDEGRRLARESNVLGIGLSRKVRLLECRIALERDSLKLRILGEELCAMKAGLLREGGAEEFDGLAGN